MKDAQALAVLQALASDVRLGIYRELLRHAPDGLVAGELAKTQGLSPANLSFHLKALHEAGLVVSLSEGRNQRYRVDTGKVGALVDYLASECCRGRPEVCALPSAKSSQCC